MEETKTIEPAAALAGCAASAPPEPINRRARRKAEALQRRAAR